MENELIERIKIRDSKAELLHFCEENDCWRVLKRLCFHNSDLISWRSAWLLSELPKKDLEMLGFDVQAMIDHATKKSPSVQREAFKLLEKLSISQDAMSSYFDWAVRAWLDIANPSGLRITALRAMVRVGKYYPELNREVNEMGDDKFLESLSPGIQAQAVKIFQKLI
jgi:hypothetical protein